jgi:elongator complex protein 3
MSKNKRQQIWQETKALTPEKMVLAHHVLEEVRAGSPVMDALRRHPLAGGGYLGKYALVAAYNQVVLKGEEPDEHLFELIRMKPVRTLSGVATVTVLTKPYPCPGECIYCPTDPRMPKSYLPDEPGAMRGLEYEFDPYTQLLSRLQGLESIGHPTDKIELLILGGTWSSYPLEYQEWFVRRCFDALNGVDSDTLLAAQTLNESARHRNVGLVIETRPDMIDLNELSWLRYLGVTKVQLGAQSLSDHILKINRRGHTTAVTRYAVMLLRAAGFKIVLHWMPNLLGATPETDYADFAGLWDGFCPDEIKIYPTQLLENTELHTCWQRGEYKPYTTQVLIDLIANIKPTIPRYCRVNRVIRDIPSTHVVEGNRRTSLRQDVHAAMKNSGTHCQCIRCREVRKKQVAPDKLHLDDSDYLAANAREHFLSFVTPDDRIAALLRLSLPSPNSPQTGLHDLKGAALIRELHVYGQSLPIGMELDNTPQHCGLGMGLLEQAERVAYQAGYKRLAVISAVGTRQYYLERGFERGDCFLVKNVQ